MHKYSKIFIFIVCVLLGQIKSFAVEVTDLYTAKVPVASKSDREKKLALKNAMKAVILKVAGQPQVLSNTAIKQALNKNYQYYTQFRYQKIDDQKFLSVSFDENKINGVLSQAQLPIWGRLRPNILLWVVDEKGFTRKVISQSVESFIPENIALFSETRGLPFMLPEVTDADKSALSISDLWGRFSEPTLLASTQYGAESVVIIRLSNSSLVSSEGEALTVASCLQNCNLASYALDWRFITNSQRLNETFAYQGKNEAELLNKALADITEHVYKRYALTSNELQSFQIDVANIDSLADYINVKKFLAELSSVKAVTLESVSQSHRRFNLQLMGSSDAFLATLMLDKSLEQHIDPLADVDVLSAPVFYWKKP